MHQVNMWVLQKVKFFEFSKLETSAKHATLGSCGIFSDKWWVIEWWVMSDEWAFFEIQTAPKSYFTNFNFSPLGLFCKFQKW